MKTARFLLLFAIVLSIVFVSKAQSFQTVCTYRLDYQVDSTNAASRKTAEMLLLLNKDSSVFMSKGSFMQDSVLSQPETPADVRKKIWADNVTDFKFVITKDRSNELSVEDYIPSSYYRYHEPRSGIKWIITADTSTVSGFHCQKATTHYGGRIWTAWFTPDIPRNDGPYKFSGLPGLIIRMEDSQQYFIFTLISMDNRSGYVLRPAGIAEPIHASKKDFVRALDYYRSNPFEALMQSGKTQINDPGKIQAMKQNMESRVKVSNILIER